MKEQPEEKGEGKGRDRREKGTGDEDRIQALRERV